MKKEYFLWNFLIIRDDYSFHVIEKSPIKFDGSNYEQVPSMYIAQWNLNTQTEDFWPYWVNEVYRNLPFFLLFFLDDPVLNTFPSPFHLSSWITSLFDPPPFSQGDREASLSANLYWNDILLLQQ